MTTIRNIILDTAVEKVVETPWVQRYKGTILIVVTGVLGALSGIAPYLSNGPAWAGGVIAAIVTVGAAVINRFTRDGFTPSMAGRLAESAPEGEVVEPEKPGSSLPIYTGPTSGE